MTIVAQVYAASPSPAVITGCVTDGSFWCVVSASGTSCVLLGDTAFDPNLDNNCESKSVTITS